MFSGRHDLSDKSSVIQVRHEYSAEERSPEHAVALADTNHELDESRDKVKFLQPKVAGLRYEKHQLVMKVKNLEGTPSRNYCEYNQGYY